jgi:hypothetical protein
MVSKLKSISTKLSSKDKKERPSIIAQRLIDNKYFGDEPVVKGSSLAGFDLIKIFNWYNYICTKHDARKYIEEYLKLTNRTTDLKRFRLVPDNHLVLTAAWIARIIVRGGEVPSNKFDFYLSEMFKYVNKDKNVEQPKEYKQQKDNDYLIELEGMLDDHGFDIDVYEWLNKKQPTGVAIKQIIEHYKPIQEEASLLIKPKPPADLVEGYKHYNKKQIKTRAFFFTKLITDCESYISGVKKKKVVRKKKPVSVESKLKKFNYCKEYKDYKLVSIDPSLIITANELWCYNVKYKTIIHYIANENQKLDINTVNIIHYNENLSKVYKLGKKSQEYCDKLMSGNKKSLNKIFQSLPTIVVSPRITEHVLLLRVI